MSAEPTEGCLAADMGNGIYEPTTIEAISLAEHERRVAEAVAQERARSLAIVVAEWRNGTKSVRSESFGVIAARIETGETP